jgi:hypothetical protein
LIIRKFYLTIAPRLTGKRPFGERCYKESI